MARRKGRNMNTYDTVDAPTAIALNTSTYTEIADVDADRLGYTLTNDSSSDIIVKEQGFDDPDAADRGFDVFKRSIYESQQDLIPVGKISAKAKTGNPSIRIVFR